MAKTAFIYDFSSGNPPQIVMVNYSIVLNDYKIPHFILSLLLATIYIAYFSYSAKYSNISIGICAASIEI